MTQSRSSYGILGLCVKHMPSPGLVSHCEWDRLVSGLSCVDKEWERQPHPHWVVFSKDLLSDILAKLANGIKCFPTPAIC